LSCFIAGAEARQFTRAAARAGRPAGAEHADRRLEAELGASRFLRDDRAAPADRCDGLA
jgi:DNA-binding transcriptional LysR family regulator